MNALICFQSLSSWFVFVKWVNLKLTLSGKLSKEVRPGVPFFVVLKRRMMSWSVAATTKYSCFRRSSFPSKNCADHTDSVSYDRHRTTKRGMHVLSTYIVVGVKNAGDVLRQVPVQNSLDVISNINCRQVEYILVKVTHDLLYVFVTELLTESAATELFRNIFFCNVPALQHILLFLHT